MTQPQSHLEFSPAELVGTSVVAAQSALNSFAIVFDNGLGLVLQAQVDQGELLIDSKIVPGDSVPRLSEAVCSVDWSWIYGRQLEDIQCGENCLLFLKGIGKITVSVGAWQGKPFLSFMPYKAPQ